MIRRHLPRRQRWLLLAFVPLLALGCRGSRVPPPADPDRAREALRTALDAWRDGQSPAELQRQSPPLHVNDTDWQAGLRLTRYEIQGPDGRHGTQFRCPVRLTLRDEKGRAVERTVNYLVDTQPALVIVRDSF